MNYNPQEQNNFNNQPVKDGKGFSVAGLVLGILGLVGGFIPVVNYFTTVCAILGLIFACNGRKRSKLVYGKASGIATAGLVLSIIGTSFAALGVLCSLLCMGSLCAAGNSLGCAMNELAGSIFEDPDLYESLYESMY